MYVRELVDAIEKLGVRVFFPSRDIQAGEPIGERLIDAIRAARVAVVFLSKDMSSPLRAELAIAAEMADQDPTYVLIPVLDDNGLEDQLPRELRTRRVASDVDPTALAETIFSQLTPTNALQPVDPPLESPYKLLARAAESEIDLRLAKTSITSRFASSIVVLAGLGAAFPSVFRSVIPVHWIVSACVLIGVFAAWISIRTIFALRLIAVTRERLRANVDRVSYLLNDRRLREVTITSVNDGD